MLADLNILNSFFTSALRTSLGSAIIVEVKDTGGATATPMQANKRIAC